MPANIGTSDEPPELISGNVIPVIGIIPETTAIFIIACKVTIIVMPAARSDPNESGALSDVRKPRRPNIM